MTDPQHQATAEFLLAMAQGFGEMGELCRALAAQLAPKPPLPPTGPEIVAYDIQPRTIAAPGETVQLSWDVRGADRVELSWNWDGVLHTYPSSGGSLTTHTSPEAMRPQRSTTFSLIARTATQVVTRSIDVVVGGAPVPPGPGPGPVPSPAAGLQAFMENMAASATPLADGPWSLQRIEDLPAGLHAGGGVAVEKVASDQEDEE